MNDINRSLIGSLKQEWLEELNREITIKRRRSLAETAYAEAATGLARGAVVTWRWGPGFRGNYTGILSGFVVGHGGDKIFCQVKLIRKGDARIAPKTSDYEYNPEAEWRDVSEDFPHLVDRRHLRTLEEVRQHLS